LGADDRRRFARGDLALTFLIVAGLTIALTGLAVRLHVGIPAANSTQIADAARAASGHRLSYGLFPATRALLLLAAARSTVPGRAAVGVLPPPAQRRCRDSYPGPCPAQPPSPPVLVGGRLPRRLGRPPDRRLRAGAEAGAGLRGGGVRELPRRADRDGPVLA